MTLEQIDATLAAIAILRDLPAYFACSGVAQNIRTSAYLRLEREARAALTGDVA